MEKKINEIEDKIMMQFGSDTLFKLQAKASNEQLSNEQYYDILVKLFGD